MERTGILIVFNDDGRSAAHYVNVIRYSNAVKLGLNRSLGLSKRLNPHPIRAER